VSLRQWTSPKACVQIVNQGDAVMEDLVVTYGETKITGGRVLVGQSVHVWLSAGPKGPLRLDFRQPGNAASSFQIPDFDPIQILQDGFKLVLLIKTNEVQRFVDDDETQKTGSLGDRVREWIKSELGLAR